MTRLLLAVLLLAMLVSLTIGRYPVPIVDVARAIGTTAIGDTQSLANKSWVVVELIRMPRVLLVTLCGINLGLAGAAMQGVFRNPLVGPEVAGVTAGASFGGVLAIMMAWPIAAVVASSFGFGLLALAAAFVLAAVAGRNGVLALVLSGVIVGAFFSALTGLAQYLADPLTKLPAITYWLLGSFGGASYEKVSVVAIVSAAAGSLLLLLRWRINLLSLGEADAKALGIDVTVLRWTLVALVAVLVAAQVAVSGGVGFVGLIVPHLARMLVGPEHSRLLPASALMGGLYLLAMDDVARSIAAQEIPIGLLTSAIGAPIFALLFWRLQGKGWNRE